MSAFRSWKQGTDSQSEAEKPETRGFAGDSSEGKVAPRVEYRVPPHIERALITLTTQMQHCVEQIDSLERRVDEIAESVMNAPSHSDVLEVRLHSAKLAAELARTTVELRGEIRIASGEARRVVREAVTSIAENSGLETEAEIEKTASEIDLRLEQSSKSEPSPRWSQSA